MRSQYDLPCKPTHAHITSHPGENSLRSGSSSAVSLNILKHTGPERSEPASGRVLLPSLDAAACLPAQQLHKMPGAMKLISSRRVPLQHQRCSPWALSPQQLTAQYLTRAHRAGGSTGMSDDAGAYVNAALNSHDAVLGRSALVRQGLLAGAALHTALVDLTCCSRAQASEAEDKVCSGH